MREKIITEIEKEKVIAIIRGADVETCLRVSEALYEGGIRLVEVTFNNQSRDYERTEEAIAVLNRRMEGKLFTGAGTVTSVELLERARRAGAQFIISPDTNIEVIGQTRRRNLVSIPGAMTPSEILAAHGAGADFVKLFPANELGADYIKAICAPINQVKLLVVGGIDENNLGAFLAAGVCGAGIGGNLVNKKWIAEKRFDRITEAARKIVSCCRVSQG